jgi:hypothetical protein
MGSLSTFAFNHHFYATTFLVETYQVLDDDDHYDDDDDDDVFDFIKMEKLSKNGLHLAFFFICLCKWTVFLFINNNSIAEEGSMKKCQSQGYV